MQLSLGSTIANKAFLPELRRGKRSIIKSSNSKRRIPWMKDKNITSYYD
jgi:hypothetical protein